MDTREKQLGRVTLVGAAVNVLLTAIKVAAGVFGRSAAMVADGLHSLTDLVSDGLVLVFVHISSKESDEGHAYGHGKYETLATLVVCLMLLVVASGIISSGVEKICIFFAGGELPMPGMVALWAALISIVAKELLYRYTAAAGKRYGSEAVVANAWHHRSDALSSVGSMLGIGGAILLGRRWTVLDPLTGCIIGIVIVVVAVKMAIPAVQELMESSLSPETENEIKGIAASVSGVRNIHELKTRKSGRAIIADAHIVVDPDMTVADAHAIATAVEDALRERFGTGTQITIHIEPDEASR